MTEKQIENHFIWAVERANGKTWKFKSPGRRGVSDRIACLPDGSTWFVELKRPKGGVVSKLQMLFADDMKSLNQNYACLWTKEQIDTFIKTLPKQSR